ncbi:hypothetical protein RvY_13851 [Ramazzottius varieornatus]|uniref:Uncharacterized protein n=1 Tax=Ramazzottius varieornatus TaxID=947166 RepID=A0A1D1VRF7_RAMVA|nr:hypothetical protein RvY_13851 [Ramazzottius varieornatus]
MEFRGNIHAVRHEAMRQPVRLPRSSNSAKVMLQLMQSLQSIHAHMIENSGQLFRCCN